jgi:Ni/Co efflux regulator RcnB
MRKIVLALAAVGAFGLALPIAAPANAQEPKIVIRTGDRDHDRDHARRWNRDQHDEGRYHRRHEREVIVFERRHHERHHVTK